MLSYDIGQSVGDRPSDSSHITFHLLLYAPIFPRSNASQAWIRKRRSLSVKDGLPPSTTDCSSRFIREDPLLRPDCSSSINTRSSRTGSIVSSRSDRIGSSTSDRHNERHCINPRDRGPILWFYPPFQRAHCSPGHWLFGQHYKKPMFSMTHFRFIPFVWNIITAGYLETSVFGLGASIVALLLAGRHLEPFWGSREFLKFIIFVNLFTCSSTFVLAIFLYVITRQGGYLYAPISGFHGILAGFLVAVKQINPEQEIPFLKLRAKWSPSLFVAFAILSSLFSSAPIQFVPFIVFGTYGAWMYLRYFHKKPEACLKGDSSAEFAFASFFPAPLQNFINPISSVFEKIFCGHRSQQTSVEGPSVEPGKPLPGSDSVEASRRRERGARALEERLSSFNNGIAEGLPMSISSKGDLESKGSNDLV